jgi:hypothetical protein
MASGFVDLSNIIDDNILSGGRRTTAVKTRVVFDEIIASTLNIVDGGNVIQSLAGYVTDLTPTDDKHFTPKKYVDDQITAAQSYVDGLVVGLWDDRGTYDASTNVFPSSGGSGTAGALLKGDIFTVSVAGTLGGSAVNIGDTVRVLTDTPGQTASNWAILENNIGYVPLNSAGGNMTGNVTFTNNNTGLVYPAGTTAKEIAGVFTIVATGGMSIDGTLSLFENISYQGSSKGISWTVGHTILNSGLDLRFTNTVGEFRFSADMHEFIGGPVKLTELTASTFVYLNASKEIVSLANSAGFLINNGSGTFSYSALTGDVTTSSAAATLSEQTRWQTVKISCTSAEILALNTTPKQILATPGAGKLYSISDILVVYTVGTVPYVGNVNLRVIYTGSTRPVAENALILTSTVNRTGNMAKSAITATAVTQYMTNTALVLTTETGNPITGDGTIDVYVTYKIVTL